MKVQDIRLECLYQAPQMPWKRRADRRVQKPGPHSGSDHVKLTPVNAENLVTALNG